MELKLIQKNGENILPICFYGKNRNESVLEYHKKVMDFYQIPMNYIEFPFHQTGHGDAIQWFINQTIQNFPNDYYWFCDMDCIPTNKDFIHIMYDKIKDNNTVFGPALSTNHRNSPQHIYCAAFCLAFSKKLYIELGCPTMTDVIERSDTGQELSWVAQENGKNLFQMFPRSFNELTQEEINSTGNPKYWELGKLFKYGLGTEYQYVFHAFMQNIPRSSEVFIKRCKEILGESDARDLDCLVVSVNCSDYLELTLPENVKYFDNYYVATIESDAKTIELCKKYGATAIICPNPHNINGHKFDKGLCIQECLERVTDRNRWILLLDSDIILPSNFRELLKLGDLNTNVLYGASRSFAWDYNEYLEYKAGKKIDDFENIPGGFGCGYFMLFNLNSNKIKNVPLREIYSNGNLETDMILLEKFHPERTGVGKLDFKVLHLGPHGCKFDGRFNGNEKFDCLKNKQFKDIPNIRNLLNEN